MGAAVTWLAKKQADVYICGLLCWEKFYFTELAAPLLLLGKKETWHFEGTENSDVLNI